MNIIIVSAGELAPDYLKTIYNDMCRTEAPYVIGVDRGVLTCDTAHIDIDYYIGDFDSVDETDRYEIIRRAAGNGAVLNPVKDDTDTEHAVRYAMSLNPDHVVMLGATGSRMDHTFTSVRLLKLFEDNGIDAVILDEHNRIRVMDGSRGRSTFDKKNQYGYYVSILPFAEDLKHVNISGFKYDMKDGHIDMLTGLGVSNEIVSDEAYIEFEGCGIIMETRD